MYDKKLPALIIQFCSFYYNNIEDFKKNLIRHLHNLFEETFENRENLVSVDIKPIYIGEIIPSIFLSDKSNFFIYHIFDFDNAEQIIQLLENDLSTLQNPEEDVVVKFVCDFQIKN